MHPHQFPAAPSASSWFAKTGPEHAAFDLLVDRLIAQLRAGEIVDWSAVNRDHPEHGGRLRSMAVALEALGDLSGVSASAIARPTRRPEGAALRGHDGPAAASALSA